MTDVGAALIALFIGIISVLRAWEIFSAWVDS